MLRRDLLSRRSLLGAASRAAVGTAGMALVGCASPEVFNERETGGDAEESDVRGGETGATEEVEIAQPEPAPPVRPERARRAISGSYTTRVALSPADSEWAVVIPHGQIDLDEWRRRYHWRRLQALPGRTEGPRPGGRLVLHGRSPRLWSPIVASREQLTPGGVPPILQLLYSQLVVFASGDDADPHRNVLAGDLARSWEIPDERSLIFRIRDDVRWPSSGADDGRAFRASDARYMHEMYRDENISQFGTYRTVDRIEDDDRIATITFALSEPTSFLPTAMAAPDHVIMPPGWTPDAAGTWEHPTQPPAGTGPFRLQSWTGPAGTWALDRNEEYFKRDARTGARLPFVDGIHGGNHSWPNDLAEIHTLRDQVWRDWREGWFDGLGLERPGELLDALEYFPDVAAELVPPMPGRGSRLTFAANAAHPIEDARIRIALSAALDRVKLAAEFHDGLAVPDCGMNWAGVEADRDPTQMLDWPWRLEDLGENYQYDPARAGELLRAAGYTAEQPLRIGIDSGTVEGLILADPAISPTNLGIIRGQWSKALGDLAEVRIIHRAPRGSDPLVGHPPHPDANVLVGEPSRAHPADPDPSTHRVPEWARSSPDFDMYGTGGDAVTASLWDEQRRALDPSERSEALEGIRRRRAEMMPEIHLVNPCGLFVRRADVFDLGIAYFAHDPLDAPKQLERTWKSAGAEGD